jgi:hypothetical protein
VSIQIAADPDGTGGTGGTVVERTVPRSDSAAIVVEEVAHVVYATLESLLGAQEPPPPPPVAPPEPPAARVASPPEAPREAPVRRPAESVGFGLDGAVFVTGFEIASNSGAVVGGGGGIELLLAHAPLRPGLWLTGTFLTSFDAQGQLATLETSMSSFRALPSIRVAAIGPLRWDVGAGAGVDFFHTIPRNPSRSTVDLGSTQTLADPVLDAQLLMRIRIASGVRLLLGFDLAYDIGLHRYSDVDRDKTARTVLEPWAWRPSALAGLCIPIAGFYACGGSE